MVTDASECAEADSSGFPATVEWGPHRVQIYKQVGVDDGSVDLNVESSFCVTKVDQLIRVFGVVAVKLVVSELEYQASSEEGFHLSATELAVETLGAKERNVVEFDSGAEYLIDYQLDSHLPEVCSTGLKIGARGVIECYGDFGFGTYKLRDTLMGYGIVDGVSDCLLDVGHRGQWRVCSNGPSPIRYLYR